MKMAFNKSLKIAAARNILPLARRWTGGRQSARADVSNRKVRSFMASLDAHYSVSDIEARILAAVRAAGLNPDNIMGTELFNWIF